MNRLLRKTLSLMLAAVMLLCAAPAVLACRPSGPIAYNISILRSGGDPLEDVPVVILDRNKTYVGSSTTDANGKISFEAPADTYTLIVTPPAGYGTSKEFTVTAKNPSPSFKLSASIIKSAAPAGTQYELGSVLYDYSFKDTRNNDYSLSKILETKKAILLNFWFINCSYCVLEFPDMADAYGEYSDDIEIVALNYIDNSAASEQFRINPDKYYGDWEEPLPFILVGNDQTAPAALATSFGIDQCPTSIMIDREGVVCYITGGAGTFDEFTALFSRYTAEPYTQKIFFPGSGELDKPDVTPPAPEAIASAVNNTQSGFNATYYGEDDDNYNWPWVIAEDGGIKASNSGHHNSYSIINTNITATNSQVIAFDYKVSCEANADYLHVFIDDVLTHTFTGISDEWNTCYAYVPQKASGTYKLTLIFLKDESRSTGDDTAYIKNMRFVSPNDIDARTEIIYRCASGARTNFVYENYITPVYNSTDKYYHVGSEDGPLIIADLMNNGTAWKTSSAWSFAMNGELKADLDGDGSDEDYFQEFTVFCQHANNSKKSGYVGVTEELKKCLDALVTEYGHSGENEWLELCSYYKVYGGNDQLGDPAEGLATYNAFTAKLDDGTGLLNRVKKQNVLMPRGLWYKFVPTETAIYNAHSVGEVDTYVWLADANGNRYAENDDADNFTGDAKLAGNFSITDIFEKGKTYYIIADFNSVDTVGEFDFCLTKLASSGNIWVNASAGMYEQTLDEHGDVNGVRVAAAVDYVLNTTDNCYHVGSANGPLLYINLCGPTNMFPSHTISGMVNMYCYYCTVCGSQHPATVSSFEKSGNDVQCPICFAKGKNKFNKKKMFELPSVQKNILTGKTLTTAWPFEYDGEVYYNNVPKYVLEGTGHSPDNYLTDITRYGIKFTDYTAKIAEFVDNSMVEANCPNEQELMGQGPHMGYAPADRELVDILQKLFIFGDYSYDPDIDNAWLLLARYYKHLG